MSSGFWVSSSQFMHQALQTQSVNTLICNESLFPVQSICICDISSGHQFVDNCKQPPVRISRDLLDLEAMVRLMSTGRVKEQCWMGSIRRQTLESLTLSKAATRVITWTLMISRTRRISVSLATGSWPCTRRISSSSSSDYFTRSKAIYSKSQGIYDFTGVRHSS